MDIVDLETTKDDAKDFLYRIRTIITGSLICYNAQDFFLIHVDNWFGDRWLRFSGKILGAAGVFMKSLTIPPFIPERVLSIRHFVFDQGDNRYKISNQNHDIHIYQNSDQNLRRQIGWLYPNSAFFWYSSNTKSNGRGCLMAYIPTPEGHWPWYIEFVSKPWRVNKFVEISEQEIDHFDKALKLDK